MAGGETQSEPTKPELDSGEGASDATKKKGKSKLIAKFKTREIDPFAAQNLLVLQDMESGMRDLLDLHNPAELSSLCAMLGMPSEGITSEEKVAQIMAHVKGPANKPTEKDYINLMKMMWEGVMFEYLRSIGQPLRSCALDPREFIIRYWRRRITDPKNMQFVPYYLVKKFEQRSGKPRHERDIAGFLDAIEAAELAVKQAETCLRRENDYRFVFRYFTAVADLHKACKEGMDFMVNEAEILRARIEHGDQNMKLMTEQLFELEFRHEVLKDHYVEQGAFEEALTDSFMGVLGNNTADRQEAIRLIRAIFEDMGQTYRDDEESCVEQESLSMLAESFSTLPLGEVHRDLNVIARLRDLQKMLKDEIGRLDSVTRDAVQKMKYAQNELLGAQTEAKNQKARAERAEKNVQTMRKKFDNLMTYSSKETAEAESTSEILLGLVTNHGRENYIMRSRLETVTPLLLKLAGENDQEKQTLAITLLEALGIMTRDEVLSHLEQLQMMNEDFMGKTVAATDGIDFKPAPKPTKKKAGAGGKKKR